MTVAHSSLTGSDLHEPKGVASATSGQEYVANGAGSGTWTTVYTRNVAYVYGYMVDISAANTIYLPVPFNGTATNIWVTLNGAITVANAIITVKNNAGTAMASTLTVTFSGSAAGSTYTTTLTTNNTFTSGQSIQINSDGGSSTSREANICIKFTVTG